MKISRICGVVPFAAIAAAQQTSKTIKREASAAVICILGESRDRETHARQRTHPLDILTVAAEVDPASAMRCVRLLASDFRIFLL